MAGLLIHLGDYASALHHAEIALQIREELGLPRAFAYHTYSWAAFHNGQYTSAVRVARQGLELVGQKDAFLSIMLLLTLGDGYTGLGEWGAAGRAFTEAWRQAENGRFAAEALTARARIVDLLWRQGERDRAKVAGEAISDKLLTFPLGVLYEPLCSYLGCYRALETTVPEQARPLLEKAYQILAHQAERMEDWAEKRRFLEDVPARREIVAAWDDRVIG